MAAVKQAYWTLKATIANVRVQQRSLELAEELAREPATGHRRADSPLDLVQAEAEVAQRRENLIRARRSQRMPKTRCGADCGSVRYRVLAAANRSFRRATIVGQAPDVDAAVAGASTRYDRRAARNLRMRRRTWTSFKPALPDVRLETSYRGNGLAGTQFLRTGGFPGVITGTRDRSFADALGQAFSPDYPTWSVGVTVSYPLGRSYEEASLARAQVETRQVEQRISSLRIQAAETVRKAGRQIQSASQRVDAARGATLASSVSTSSSAATGGAVDTSSSRSAAGSARSTSECVQTSPTTSRDRQFRGRAASATACRWRYGRRARANIVPVPLIAPRGSSTEQAPGLRSREQSPSLAINSFVATAAPSRGSTRRADRSERLRHASHRLPRPRARTLWGRRSCDDVRGAAASTPASPSGVQVRHPQVHQDDIEAAGETLSTASRPSAPTRRPRRPFEHPEAQVQVAMVFGQQTTSPAIPVSTSPAGGGD